MKSFLAFITYNNAVPIFVSVMVAGAGAVFASTDTGQQVLTEVIGEAVQVVMSVDNSYLLSTDFEHWTPTVSITDVTEDEIFYYVSYTLSTLNPVDSVWQNVSEERVMKIEKAVVASYTSLAAYVQFQLKDVVLSEKDRLQRTQEIQKSALTTKTTAIAYTGLLGMVLSDTTIVDDPFIGAPGNVSLATQPGAPLPSANDTQHTTNASGVSIQLLGNIEAQVPVGATYIDIGAIARDSLGNDLSMTVTINNVPTSSSSQVTVDTSAPAVYTIIYSATDTHGNTGSATRTVTVGDPSSIEESVPEPEAEPEGIVEPELVPEPVPEPVPVPSEPQVIEPSQVPPPEDPANIENTPSQEVTPSEGAE